MLTGRSMLIVQGISSGVLIKYRPGKAWLLYRVCVGECSLNVDLTKHGYHTGYVLGSIY